MEFTEERMERYSRHILLKEVGVEGQRRLWNSRILIIGAGGLGSPVALYLAAAGVGTIGIADGDVVDLSNLQRQVIHFSEDVGKPKTVSAEEKIRRINPDVNVRLHNEFVYARNIAPMIAQYDFVIDGTDNFAAKFLINDACVLTHRPYSHGGILKFSGQTMTVLPGQSACYRCAFPSPPPPGIVPSCSQAGVLGAIAGILGTIQAAEALKFVTGAGTPLVDALLYFDALDMSFRKVPLQRNPDCPVCGTHPSIRELKDEAPAVCEQKSCSGTTCCG
ncbi:MAG: HesA/MoeB/ThiF family protein [Acidobacteriota bacterium]|nr:HesA/MoeB/ThiF family protein [Acidobacteriota bacterium]